MWQLNPVTQFLAQLYYKNGVYNFYGNIDRSEVIKQKIKTTEDDMITKVIGEFGKWQCYICVFMALIKLPNAWYQMNIIFMAPPQEFWCAKPDKFMYPEEEWRRICSPVIQEHPCLIYDPEILIFFPFMDKKLINLVACKKFVYNNTLFKRTITSEWDLVCKKHWLIHLTQSLIMWGILVGSIVFAILADKFGRRKPLMIAIVIQAIFGIWLYFVKSFVSFLIVWVLLGFATGGVGIIPFVLSMEVVGGKYRTTVPILYQIPFGVGIATMAGLAYLLRDWRKMELALGILSALFCFYYLIIPESPRWLLATGETKRALKILKRAAKINNREFDRNTVLAVVPKRMKLQNPGFRMFFKSPNMRLKTVILSLQWFCSGLTFYTFAQYLSSLASNIFLTVSLTGFISTLGGIFCYFIINKLDRKTTIGSFQFLTGVCFLLILVTKILYDRDWIRIAFAGLGFAGMAGYIPALNLYSGELFPTLGRNVGMSGVTTFARIASLAAPAVVYLDTVVTDLPLMLMTGISFLQVLLLMPLPETQGMALPDTLEEAELF